MGNPKTILRGGNWVGFANSLFAWCNFFICAHDLTAFAVRLTKLWLKRWLVGFGNVLANRMAFSFCNNYLVYVIVSII